VIWAVLSHFRLHVLSFVHGPAAAGPRHAGLKCRSAETAKRGLMETDTSGLMAVYINLLREPTTRAISNYYYVQKVTSGTLTGTLRKRCGNWLMNGACPLTERCQRQRHAAG
jgi:hypothetical protein